MKRLLVNLLKLGLSLAIVTWLVGDVVRSNPDIFATLRDEPKSWPHLGAAGVCLLAALMVGWTRWCMISRTLGLDISLRDTYRLGFAGYTLDFLALGTAGGDAAKAILLGREQNKRWGEAVASVVLDRLIGLFSLSIVASVALAIADLEAMDPALQGVARVIQVLAAAATVGVALLFVPRVNRVLLEDLPRRLPRIGRRVGRMTDAVRRYDQKRTTLPAIIALSLLVPCLNVTAFHLIAHGLPFPAPSLLDHFVIIPPAMLSGVVPLPMEALGVFEYATNFLYEHVGDEGAVAGRGLLVALTYRLLTIGIILAGTPVFLGSKRTVRDALEVARADEAAG